MKAPMSKRLREMALDPKKIQALYEEIARLHAAGERISKDPVINMGDHQYKVQLISVGHTDKK